MTPMQRGVYPEIVDLNSAIAFVRACRRENPPEILPYVRVSVPVRRKIARDMWMLRRGATIFNFPENMLLSEIRIFGDTLVEDTSMPARPK